MNIDSFCIKIEYGGKTMSLDNKATPYYYGQFRDAVVRGEIPVCREISLDRKSVV